MEYIIYITIVLALIYDFLNGMNDAANSVATIVSTRVLSPFRAVLWAAFFNFAAYFLFGLNVANTIGKGIINPQVVNTWLVFSAITGAGLWVYICTALGLPISVSHALIGGMIGPTLFTFGFSSLVFSGILKVVLFIVLSPIIGFILSYLLITLTKYIVKKYSTHKVNSIFKILQLISSALFSLGHGSNDAQKTMGIIAVLLFSNGMLNGNEFYVPEWVVISCYVAIALGTLTGGWKVIQTMGVNLTDLKPIHGFAAETSGAFSLFLSSALGIPVSTTHTIAGSIIGVGVSRRVSSVRWNVAVNIIWAWILTIPTTMIVSGLIYELIKLFKLV